MQITEKTAVESIVFLGGRMVSITTTVEELIKEVEHWHIRYWSSALYDKELRLYNYENFKEKAKILGTNVVIVVKLVKVDDSIVSEFVHKLIEFIGKSTGMVIVK